MNRFLYPARGLLALTVTVVVCALGAVSASADTGKTSTAPFRGGPGAVALPSGSSSCQSTASKPSSASAACGSVAGSGTTAVGQVSGSKSSSKTQGSLTGTTSFTISLAASPVALAPGGTTTLTATTNQNVGPTPYYIEIFDATAGAFLTECATGTSCSASVTQGGSAVRNYVAYVSCYGTTYPPSCIQATSNWVTVSWLTVSLSASYVALAPGGTTTLTATASMDIGPTPYFIEIFDATAGSLVVECGYGSSCSANVTQSGSTVRNYAAYVSNYSTTFPPSNVRASSNWVNVSWLTASIGSSRSGSYLDVTGYASLNVGPTPYYIEVFEWNHGSPFEVAICGSGTSCSTGWLYRPSADYYITYISGYGTSWTPPNIRASSNWIYA
jgi:hypothetical protein